MNTISIVFSRASTTFPIFSWLIMLTERTTFSHVAIRMVDLETNQDIVIQASHTLVNEMSWTEFLAQEKVIYQFDFLADDETKKLIKTFAINNLGKPYGVMSILGLSLVQLLSFIGIKITNPFKDSGKTYVCSELISAILQSVDGVILPQDVEDMTPKSLFPLVQSLPKTLTSTNTTLV